MLTTGRCATMSAIYHGPLAWVCFLALPQDVRTQSHLCPSAPSFFSLALSP